MSCARLAVQTMRPILVFGAGPSHSRGSAALWKWWTDERFLKKWMVARMNEYGDVNARVNAEKCTGNDSVWQDAFARFTFFRWRELERVRKTDVDDDVATTVNFSHRRVGSRSDRR